MAVDMFLKLDGVTGESQDSKHGKEIDVLAWSWGASNSGTMHLGSGGGAGKASFQDISLTKYLDLSTTTLMTSVANGSHFKDAVLTVRKAGGKEPVEYLIITMEKVFVTSLGTGGSGGEDRLTENISLNFESFKMKYTEQDATGKKGTSPEMKWNIVKNAES